MTTSGEDVIDADYVVVASASRRPNVEPRAVEPTTEAAAGMDMLRGATAFEPPARVERGSPLFWVAGVAIVAMAFWSAGGYELARLGTSANTLSSSQLRIAAFNSRVIETGARPTLVIDGEAINDGTTTTMLPPLEVQVTSGNGTLTRYKLGTAGAQLASGDVFPFSGRLDLPKHGVKTVSVAFVE